MQDREGVIRTNREVVVRERRTGTASAFERDAREREEKESAVVWAGLVLSVYSTE